MRPIPLRALRALQGLPQAEKEQGGLGVEQRLVLQGGQAAQVVRAKGPGAPYREPVGAAGPATGVRQEPVLLQPCVVDDPW
ncbi:MAG: hypothetical protein DWC11_07390 [Candidatus Poseidoniales archaeon]|nr:MAG: hypothetical protein DWC11_07390 [Candidatus Poseidoniales archaeon]